MMKSIILFAVYKRINTNYRGLGLRAEQVNEITIDTLSPSHLYIYYVACNFSARQIGAPKSSIIEMLSYTHTRRTINWSVRADA